MFRWELSLLILRLGTEATSSFEADLTNGLVVGEGEGWVTCRSVCPWRLFVLGCSTREVLHPHSAEGVCFSLKTALLPPKGLPKSGLADLALERGFCPFLQLAWSWGLLQIPSRSEKFTK